MWMVYLMDENNEISEVDVCNLEINIIVTANKEIVVVM